MKMKPSCTYLLKVIFHPLGNIIDGGIYYNVLKWTECACISNKLINLLAFSLLHVEVVMQRVAAMASGMRVDAGALSAADHS